MSKINLIKIFILILLLSFNSCSETMKELGFDLIRRGTLKDNEYDYYTLALPSEYDRDSHLIIELEPNKELDSLNNIISDPNLYISTTEKKPNIAVSTWKSDRFGDETISISPSYLNPLQEFYISVHCKEKCNYVIKAQLVKEIEIKENNIYNYNLNPNTVTTFSFTTRDNFTELYVNIFGSYINNFHVYCERKNPSSSNTLIVYPISFNGYRYILKKYNSLRNLNTNTKFYLVVDNEEILQSLSVWLHYDNENIMIKEADILYDSIPENKAHCYYYYIDYINKDKDIIISTNLFNGYGFLYMVGYNPVNPDSITLSDKNKIKDYNIYQNKAIHLTINDYQNFGNFIRNTKNYLYFCFFAEKSSSLSMKVYFLENYKRLQSLNIIYPAIPVEDIIPKNSVKKYKLEHYNIESDIHINLVQKTGKIKLYLFMMSPEEENIILENNDLEKLKENKEFFEGKLYFNTYYLNITKELNKCIKKQKTDKDQCYLDAIIECKGDEDCTYSLEFDHKKGEIILSQKQMYTNVISENEYVSYKIIISEPSIKNLVIVLTQNSGKAILRLNSFISEQGGLDFDEEVQNNEFLPNLIKINNELLNVKDLTGIFSITVQGLSYASYSLYYYTFNDEEKEKKDLLNKDIDMKLEKGMIIRDIFMDSHRFKVYVYECSLNKNTLFIGLIETDNNSLELYVFKNLEDFSFNNNIIKGYLWKGNYKDYLYIDKNDEKYIENDVLYIVIFKKSNYIIEDGKDRYTSFYLGITEEDSPLIINEGIEFKLHLTTEHSSQKFYYYFLTKEKDQDLQISFSLFFGHITVKIGIENNNYMSTIISEENALIKIKRDEINNYCKNKENCGISIDIQNDNDFLQQSQFFINVRNAKNTPMILKQGVVTKKTILIGEEQHFIIDIKPEKTFKTKITTFFKNSQGEVYVRKLLNSEIYDINNFPDEKNYEYIANDKNSKNGFYIIEIPYDNSDKQFRLLLTVKGLFSGYYSSVLEYIISVSNIVNEIIPDKNYNFFIAKGEISNFHFKVGINKKRLYISMANKDKEANMFLSYDDYISDIYEYHWKSIGSYNEYLDISINDPYFVERGMTNIDGDYYLAIQGVEDTFYNLYISSQDVKIIALDEGIPGGCACETENDNCYFRYEVLNNPFENSDFEKKIVFYTEFTYGSGSMSAKIFKNGKIDDILKNLPNSTNNDIFEDDDSEFLFIDLNDDNSKQIYNNIIIVGVQCKEKSLFDLSAAVLDDTVDMTKNIKNTIFLRLNNDNLFYLSPLTGSSTFLYKINNNQDMSFRVRALLGKVEIHIYTNYTTYFDNVVEEKDENSYINKYNHITDLAVDSNIKGKKEYFGKVPKLFGYGNYLYFDVKPIENSLINININYNEEMASILLNKEIIGMLKEKNYYAYFDFKLDIEEVIISVTSLNKEEEYNVYLKTNIINKNDTEDNNKISMPSSENYDIKGVINPITSSLFLRIKNVPKEMRTEYNIIRSFINIESFHFSDDSQIKILVTPVINSVTRIKPEQNLYYFSNFGQKESEKLIYILKNTKSVEDNLMIIEISSCQGDFKYVITESPPLDKESYTQLEVRKIPSDIYYLNGKTIITIRNLEKKEYYLILFGADTLDLFIDEKNEENKERTKDNKDTNNDIDLLFVYYTINEKNYNYLVTIDLLNIESKGNSIKINIPELKKRDTSGREQYADSMNYTLIISDQKKDFTHMSSTCYLTKMQQSNLMNKMENINIEYNKDNNAFIIEGLKGGETYYMNILAKNVLTGEIITYRPVMVLFPKSSKILKIVGTIFLSVIILIFLCIAFRIYRKYRIQKMQLDFVREEKEKEKDSLDKKIGDSKNIDLDYIKKNYNNLTEENQGIIND